MLKATRRNNCSSASLTSSFKAALGVLAGVCRASLSVGLQLRSITELPETAQICNYGVLVLLDGEERSRNLNPANKDSP